MPHTFTNRTRKFANLLGVDPDKLRQQFRWEWVNSFCYEFGSCLFVVASILTLPAFSVRNDNANKSLSAILIIAASCCFLVVSVHDGLEFYALGKDISKSDFVAVVSYILGSFFPMVGSVFQYDWAPSERFGYFTFMCGSVSFIFGSVLNSLHIFESPTRRTAQYFLLTAISFIIGSTMFLVGSAARFTLSFASSEDWYSVNTFVAAFYIVGSVMFCLGGLFNALRFRIVFRRNVREHRRNHPLKALEHFLGIESSGGDTSGFDYYGSMDGSEEGTEKKNESADEETKYEKDREEDLAINTRKKSEGSGDDDDDDDDDD